MVPQLVGLTLVLWLTGHCMHLLFNMYHIKLLFNLQYIDIHYCFDSSQLCNDDRKTCFVSSGSSSSQANSSPIHHGKGFTSKTDIPISQNLWQYPCIARLLFPPTPQSSAVLNFDCNSLNSSSSHSSSSRHWCTISSGVSAVPRTSLTFSEQLSVSCCLQRWRSW